MNYCYILANTLNNKTYVGYTNNPLRRLRQHNGEIKGGAMYTTRCLKENKNAQWFFLSLVTSQNSVEFTKNVALSLEWHLKFEYRKPKFSNKQVGIHGRLQALLAVLSLHPKFSSATYRAYIDPEHVKSFLHDIPLNVTYEPYLSSLLPTMNVIEESICDDTLKVL